MPWPQNAYVGQKVVCIDGTRPYCLLYSDGIQPQIDCKYTIVKIGPYHDEIHVDIAELPKYSPKYCDWNISRFRPLQSTSTSYSLLARLQDPTNHRNLDLLMPDERVPEEVQ